MKLYCDKYDYYLNADGVPYQVAKEGMPDERPTFCDDDYEPPIVFDIDDLGL